MNATTAIINPYWDALRSQVDTTGSLWDTPSVGGIRSYRQAGGDLDADRWAREAPKRYDFVNQYAWTITDPDTVSFIAEHSHGRLVDPMAGTGYWAWILTQAGVDVVAYDLNPPVVDSERNHWHRNVAAHVTIGEADAKDSVWWHPSRTLLLSWPPYGFDACPILDAYKGSRVIYIGEEWGGCCGDDGLFQAFERDWVKVAERVPVQWDGMHDVVHVYDRREAA
ncbi:hypothetical protein [Verrucosispora sp. NA02020]|uniref:hypothetical protein n=1 Tax=Verrucosispora sp. NA02020 TaxID=2742132 RepID=UPI00159173D5|nr:hypothetical protein [Verrucosispora sp. NA02020]QKW15322.1 hypothetical protein HUT12_22885 [Verrucosispora sp. NA02020]